MAIYSGEEQGDGESHFIGCKEEDAECHSIVSNQETPPRRFRGTQSILCFLSARSPPRAPDGDQAVAFRP